jgi:hypothetical protein
MLETKRKKRGKSKTVANNIPEEDTCQNLFLTSHEKENTKLTARGTLTLWPHHIY